MPSETTQTSPATGAVSLATSLPIVAAPVPNQEPDLLTHLLREQQTLTAVDQFSHAHDDGLPAQSQYYAKLLPATPPEAGQQYAFEVDLDRCSGCKACVTACHALNGLDEQETWRDVGLLIGGTTSNPVMQHVTTACHHCLEPGCMSACPVDAYEKDPVTGIVKHLDDQCFGCQYCTLACPYDVPKYHAGKGIVRKCDMCSDRLVVGEAPACVQACPHEAISIRVVDVQQVIEDAEADHFLPAAPDPQITLPTTHYKTSRVFPRNTLPADYHTVSSQHPHWPLIVMLVLTQLSVGAFVVGLVLERTLNVERISIRSDSASADNSIREPRMASNERNEFRSTANVERISIRSDSASSDNTTPQPRMASYERNEFRSTAFRQLHATTALGFGLLALAASTMHLGRPQYAFRAVIGLRHSWLSREIVAFGAFAGAACLFAGICWISPESPLRPVLAWSVAVTGVVGVFCSVMIYVVTGREFWSLGRTAFRFGMTSVVMGIAATWLSILVFGVLFDVPAAARLSQQTGVSLVQALVVAAMLKLIVDASLLHHLMSRRQSALKRAARLMVGPLSGSTFARFACGLLGGVIMPLFLWKELTTDDSRGLFLTISVAMLFAACLTGELLERYQFFAACASPRMPGGLHS